MEKYGMSFKEMNKKQKAKHIWVYYRYHILAAIIFVVVVGLLGKTIFFPAPENDVDVMICGPMHFAENETQEIDQFKKDYNVGLSLTPLSWDNDAETANVMIQKIPLMITVKSLEILALPEEQYQSFAKIYGQDMFTPLENVPELSELLEEHKDDLFTCDKAVDEDGNEIDAEEHVYGIKVSGFPGITCIDQSGDMVIGLTSVMRDQNKAICMYQYILGDQSALEHYNDDSDKAEE